MIPKLLYLFVQLQFLCQINGFLLNLEPVGTKQAAVTTGDVITYNVHMTITDSTPLSFYATVPHTVEGSPIFNIESIQVLGVGSNLQMSNSVPPLTENMFTPKATLDFGVVNRTGSGVSTNDEIVVQVKSRVLKRTEIVTGEVFWLYFGMDYQYESIWVIGKSVTILNLPGSAKLTAKIENDNMPMATSEELGFDLLIHHTDDSKGTATAVEVILYVPTWFTLRHWSTSSTISYTATQVGRKLTITVNDPIPPGDFIVIELKFTIGSVVTKGKVLKGHIYGDISYATGDENPDCTSKQVKKNNIIQKTVSFYSQKDTCDSMITIVNPASLTASSASTDPSQAMSAPGDPIVGWQPWGGVSSLVDNYLQINFVKTTTLSRLLTAGDGLKFVKTFHVSYSKDGVFWEFVRHLGKPKEFQGNTDGPDKALTVFEPAVVSRYLRLHPKQTSNAGASLHIMPFGCQASDTLPFEVHERSFIAAPEIIVVCVVRPDKTRGKTNCYCSSDTLKWDGIDPRVSNVIGYDPATHMMYGLGISSKNNDVYMEIQSPLRVRVISKAAWDTIKDTVSGLVLPKPIPLKPVNGNRMDEIAETTVTVGDDTFVATPEGLLKNSKMIVSWVEYKPS